MAELDELRELAEGQDGDDDLVKKLRSALNERLEGYDPKKLSELEAENSQLKRQTALDAAEIPTDGFGAYFRQTYAGDPTPEAVKEAAEKAGLLKPPEPSATPIEQQAHRGIAEASSTPPAPPTGFDDKMRELHDPNDLKGSYDRLLALMKETPGFEMTEGLDVA